MTSLFITYTGEIPSPSLRISRCGYLVLTGQCTATGAFNWDRSKNGSVPIPGTNPDNQSWGGYFAGGSISATGGVNLGISGLTDMTLDYSISLSGIASAGFFLFLQSGSGSTSLDPFTFPIWGKQETYLGFSSI
jgi:hypothetical protein